jgi:malate dehydrogenase
LSGCLAAFALESSKPQKKGDPLSTAKDIVEACGKHCPAAVLGLITSSVNSVVPAMCELYTKAGLDPRKICGVTSLDAVRANKFLHEATGKPMEKIDVTVVGGHAGATVLPLFSQVPAAKSLTHEQLAALDKRVQDAGADVMTAKGGAGRASLSMAYAASKFGNAVLCGLAGEAATECAYVMRDPWEGEASRFPSHMALKVTFGKTGVAMTHPPGYVSQFELDRLEESIAELEGEIEAGLEFAKTESLAV